jgi:hypothetical protein
LQDFVIVSFHSQDFVIASFHLQDFVIASFHLQDFVIVSFHSQDFVIVSFHLQDFVIVSFVVNTYESDSDFSVLQNDTSSYLYLCILNMYFHHQYLKAFLVMCSVDIHPSCKEEFPQSRILSSCNLHLSSWCPVSCLGGGMVHRMEC